VTAFRVALLQATACGIDVDANRAKGIALCREARELGADLALFPEMWSVGYASCPSEPTDTEAWRRLAVGPDDPFVRAFVDLASELDMAIAITYLERWPGGPRNTVSVVDRHGEVVLTYAKVHTCDFDWERNLTPGERFEVAALDVASGPVEVGAMICYDREFPESARVLMLQGAEVVLVPNSCTWDEPRRAQLQTRAFENMVGVAMANYPEPDVNGRSVAFDPIVYEREDGSARDTTVVQAGSGEETVIAEFDMDRIRDYRRHETWGNAFRRPGAYGPITSTAVREPFVRPGARRQRPS
jgi:predicted amidohydrolase